MYLHLLGKIKTPIITKRTEFHLEGCRVKILHPRRRYINKITTSRRMYPYSFIGYLGDIELVYSCKSKRLAKAKLKSLLEIDYLGRYFSEGYGKIQWLRYRLLQERPPESSRSYPKIRIRKGLPLKIPKNIQLLLKYALLHDFFHTPNHHSKIYQEPKLTDAEFAVLLRQHHDETDHPLILTFQQYDRRAALITRQIYSPRPNRYNWKAKEPVDFESLATQIQEAENDVWTLYRLIYGSHALAQLNESMKYGHTSLRNHLLLICNLVVEDFKRKRLKDLSHKRPDGRSSP
jgi:hypothetical protein